MKKSLMIAAVVAMPLSFAVSSAQTTGVSHPDETDITIAPEVSQAPVYQPTPTVTAKPSAYGSQSAAVPVLQTRPADTAMAAMSETSRQPGLAVHEAYAANTAPAAASPDVDGEIVTRLPGPSNQLPVGTLITTKIRETISTESTQQGATFTAELTEPVLRDGAVLLPKGSIITGRVTEIHGGRRISGPAAIHLQTMSVTLPDGIRYPLRGQVLDTGIYKQTKVDSEGTILRRDHAKATVSELSLATGAGAAAGAVVGGVPGALVGGAVGAGLGTTVWLKQDRQTQLPAETRVTFSLNEPLNVGGR